MGVSVQPKFPEKITVQGGSFFPGAGKRKQMKQEPKR
jgi:hypothetical protein